jgi:catechol 2,3-dioxygenase-like lactoylglutathione lyase family enzyme
MRLNHVTLACTDTRRAVAFYRALGLHPVVLEDHYARFRCPDGDSTLSVERRESVPTSATGVYLECDDLDGVYQRLVAAGVAFDSPPTMQPWLWRDAWLRDPDGNRLCLYHAGDKRLDPPWRVRE